MEETAMKPTASPKEGPPPGGSQADRKIVKGGRAPWLKGMRSVLRPGFPSWIAPLVRAKLPGLAVLFGRDRFVLVEVAAGEKGKPRRLSHLSVHTLPEGSVVPALATPNFSSPVETATALRKAMEALPQGVRRTGISVVLPDGCARVALLDLRDIPRSAAQAAEMIRWQIRKRVPFQMDEARQSVQRFPLGNGVERVMVALALDRIVGQYEQVIESLGLQPGLLDLSTLNLANLYLEAAAGAGPEGDMVLLNLADDDFTIIVLREGVPLFYRSKPLIHGMARHPEQALLELKRELITSASYYEERLKGEGSEVRQVHVRRVNGGGSELDRLVAETWGKPPERAGQARLAVQLAEAGMGVSLVEQAAPAIGAALGR